MYQNLDAVTFDFHNTLAICDEWFQLEVEQLVPAFLRWYEGETGNPVSEDVCDRSVSIYRTLRLGVMDHGIEMDAEACVDAVLRELDMEYPIHVIKQGVCEVMKDTLENSAPVPGVIDAVRSLRRSNVKLAVVSSAVFHPFLEWSLEKFGIGGHFDSVVSSARCGFYKSRTEIYQTALDDLKARAGRTIHVGDSHLYDVETPSKLGMMTIWYDPEGTSMNGHKADAVVSSLTGVEHLIRNLAGGIRR